jgi:hypothetical protein
MFRSFCNQIFASSLRPKESFESSAELNGTADITENGSARREGYSTP